MIVNFRKVTNRNTPCYQVEIGNVTLTISYETVIAASNGKFSIRQKNHWGPTTGRHFKESGTYNYQIVDKSTTFEELVNGLIEDSFKTA